MSEPEAILTMYTFIGIGIDFRRKGLSHGVNRPVAKSGILANERLPSPGDTGLHAMKYTSG